jgi:hypothetical protein
MLRGTGCEKPLQHRDICGIRPNDAHRIAERQISPDRQQGSADPAQKGEIGSFFQHFADWFVSPRFSALRPREVARGKHPRRRGCVGWPAGPARRDNLPGSLENSES